MATRSTGDVWLVGPRSADLRGSKLPSKREVLAFFSHQHLMEKNTKRDSATLTANGVLDFWDRARIPTRLKKHVVASVEKMFDGWNKLKLKEPEQHREEFRDPEDEGG